jgi:hypothetical protein
MTKIRFPACAGFHKAVKQRVEQYFMDSKLAKTGDWRMFMKTGGILLWLVISYLILVFFFNITCWGNADDICPGTGFCAGGFQYCA